jgi:hypothetical protein
MSENQMADFDPVIAGLLLVWLTFFGACVGSFLNVVIYRLPLGKSLSLPPSHCPKCSHPIRWYDNVPVFGWLMLRGKCRDCKELISVRYPLVESVCGGIFGTITFLTLRRGGDASLLEFFLLVLALSGLVLTFLAAGLIAQEDKKIPYRLFIPVAILSPMMPFLVQNAFHILLFKLPHVRGESIVPIVFLYYICSNIFFTAIFLWLIEKEQQIAWLIAMVLSSLFLGNAAPPAVLLAFFLSLISWLFSRQKILTPFLTLTFSTFIFIVLTLLWF